MIRTSENQDQIATALALAQTKLENVSKSGKNPHFRSTYATLPDTLDEVRPKLAAAGIAVFQATANGEDNSSIGVITRLIHSSGQWLESSLFLPPAKFDAQSVGSLITYLRRYTLLAAVGISAGDDDGEAAVGRPAQPQAQPAPRQRARQAWGNEIVQTDNRTVQPPPDPAAYAPDIGPHRIDTDDPLDFGRRYIAGLKATSGPNEATDWAQKNAGWLTTVSLEYPKIQKSISAATAMVSQRWADNMLAEDEVQDVLR
jgi:hypothetical protein